MSTPLLEAESDQCRWIEPRSLQPMLKVVCDGVRRARSVVVMPQVFVCGKPVQAGSSFCPCHHAMAYVRATARHAVEADDAPG